MSPRAPLVAGTTEDLPALRAWAETRFTEDVHLVVAEPRGRNWRVAAVAATRFDTTVDGIPRESHLGRCISPHQACLDEPGAITARGRFETVDLAAPHVSVWAGSLQFSPDSVIDLEVILRQAPDVPIAPAPQAVHKRPYRWSEGGCHGCPCQRPGQAERALGRELRRGLV